MHVSRVATRYAKSLIQMSLEQGQLEPVVADMKMVRQAIADSRELELLLQSPVVNLDKKESILNQVFADKVSKLTMTFISILIRKNRGGMLKEVAVSYCEQYKAYMNIHTVHVTTAVAMDDQLRSKVMAFLKQHTNDQVELEEHVDASLIGGIKIRLADKQIDASVSKKLSDLKQHFSRDLYQVNI